MASDIGQALLSGRATAADGTWLAWELVRPVPVAGMAEVGPSVADTARHVVGRQLSQETRVKHTCRDTTWRAKGLVGPARHVIGCHLNLWNETGKRGG